MRVGFYLHACPPKSQRPLACAEGRMRAAPNGKTILLVEDHGDSATVVARLLSGDGYTVTVACSCAQALQQVAEKEFDLYIIDIGLPDGDGCDLLADLIAVKAAPGIALT